MLRKITLITLLTLSVGYSSAQQDTLYIPRLELADSVYADFDDSKIPSGRLFNRMFLEKENSGVFEFSNYESDTASSDDLYSVLEELKHMSLDTSMAVNPFDWYMDASIIVGEYEFEEEKLVIPLAIVDQKYQYFDLDSAIEHNLVSVDGIQIQDQSDGAVVETKNTQILGPLFDYTYANEMFFLFKEEFIMLQQRDTLEKIEFYDNGRWKEVFVGELIPFYPSDSTIQSFTFRLRYKNRDIKLCNMSLRLLKDPLIPDEDPAAKDIEFSCNKEDEYEDSDGNKLKYCLIYGCDGKQVVDKPFVLVTGYRPPIFYQGFGKTYKLYNIWHANYLNRLYEKNYDVFIVKYNISAKPGQQGIFEQAKLFVDFINDINSSKQCIGEHCYENVVQGNSQAAEVVNLAMMMKEKWHMNDNNEDHHHIRLFISNDANWHGANIPLGYQYHILSNQVHFDLNNPNPLVYFLQAVVDQKATKQLLRYHGLSNSGNFPVSPYVDADITPGYNGLRQGMINTYNYYDINNEHFIPLASSPRKIATSLGKFKGLNSDESDVFFGQPGYYYQSLYPFGSVNEIRAPIYSDNSYEKIFRRIKMNPLLGYLVAFVDHKISIKDTYEIDNTQGSFLPGFGNVIAVSDVAYFYLNGNIIGQEWRFNRQFTHKPTVSALAIHEDYWAGDGSMSADIQGLGLMYQTQQDAILDQPSQFYGYPNLGYPGNPQDHFDITPFEAIYVDNAIDPHIDLYDRPHVEELTGFLVNEIEPSYLGLQNQDFGSQARSNYLYKGKYVAEKQILVGENVTSRTDQGPFTIAPNAYLSFRAGEKIHMTPGFKAEYGCYFHAKLEYDACDNLKSATHNGGNDNAAPTPHEYSFAEQKVNETVQKEAPEVSAIDSWMVYPNPSKDHFYIGNYDGKKPERVKVMNTSGQQVLNYDRGSSDGLYWHQLPQGIYMVKIKTKGQWITKKIVVL